MVLLGNKKILLIIFLDVKAFSKDVLDRNKNDFLLSNFIEQSSYKFIKRLKCCIDLLVEKI